MGLGEFLSIFYAPIFPRHSVIVIFNLMKDSKFSSFEWLRNRDASEIIEIDIEGEFSQPSELLVENTTPIYDPKIRIQLDQVYSKLPKTFGKLPNSKSSLVYKSYESFPDWKGLYKELSITSQESFDWLKNIDSEAETTGIIEASQGIISSLPSRAIYSSILYWGCENLSEIDWMPSLRSIYYMYANRKTDLFYVIFKRIFAVFCRENNKPVVYISNPTPQLIINLKKNLVNIPEEELENENLIRVKTTKKVQMLKIEDKSVQAFYNYLANNPIETKIVANCVFLGGQLKSLNPVCNCEVFNPFEVPQQQYKLGFAGVITRQMVINLCRVMEKTQNSFFIDLIPESNSLQLPGTMPVKITRNSREDMYDIIN